MSSFFQPGPFMKLHLYGVLCSCVESEEDHVARVADLSLKGLPVLWYRKIRKEPFVASNKTFAGALTATCNCTDETAVRNTCSSPAPRARTHKEWEAEERAQALMSQTTYTSYIPIEATLDLIDDSSGPYLCIKSNDFQFVDDEDASAVSGVKEKIALMSKKIRLDSIDSIAAATEEEWDENGIDGAVNCGVVINGISKRGRPTKLLMFEIIYGSSLGRMKRDDAVQNLNTVLLWNRTRKNENPNSHEREAYRQHIAGNFVVGGGAASSLSKKEKLNDTLSTTSFTDEESLGLSDSDSSPFVLDQDGSVQSSPDRSRSARYMHKSLSRSTKRNSSSAARERKDNVSHSTTPDRPHTSSRRSSKSISKKSTKRNSIAREFMDDVATSITPDRSHASSRRSKSYSKSARRDDHEEDDSPPVTPDRSRASSRRSKSHSKSVRHGIHEEDEAEDISPPVTPDRSRASSRRSKSHSKSAGRYVHEEDDSPPVTPDRSRASSRRSQSRSNSMKETYADRDETEDSSSPTTPDRSRSSSHHHRKKFARSKKSMKNPPNMKRKTRREIPSTIQTIVEDERARIERIQNDDPFFGEIVPIPGVYSGEDEI